MCAYDGQLRSAGKKKAGRSGVHGRVRVEGESASVGCPPKCTRTAARDQQSSAAACLCGGGVCVALPAAPLPARDAGRDRCTEGRRPPLPRKSRARSALHGGCHGRACGCMPAERPVASIVVMRRDPCDLLACQGRDHCMESSASEVESDSAIDELAYPERTSADRQGARSDFGLMRVVTRTQRTTRDRLIAATMTGGSVSPERDRMGRQPCRDGARKGEQCAMRQHAAHACRRGPLQRRQITRCDPPHSEISPSEERQTSL